MTIPDIIPIAYEPWARTAKIGHYEHGQFLGSLSGAYPRSYNGRTMRGQWADHNRFYAVLHRFDHEGFHTGSYVWCEGTVTEMRARRSKTDLAEEKLNGWLADLPGLAYGPIAVRLFELVVDDVVFGLIPREVQEDGRDWSRVELEPDHLSFTAPWDGLYDT
jgi:hypothetical protein